MNIGGEIFPQADSDQFQFRLRGPTGIAIENTEKITHSVLDMIREIVGKDHLKSSVAFVGMQPSNYAVNNIHQWTSGPQEAVVEVALEEGTPVKIPEIREKLREMIQSRLHNVTISFEPANLVARTHQSTSALSSLTFSRKKPVNTQNR